MEHEPVDFFQELKSLVTDYLSARLRLFKYEVYEKSAKAAASLFSAFVTVMLAFLLLLFLSAALGFYLGSLFNSMGTGFLAVAGIYLILLLPFLLFRKKRIEKAITDRLIAKLTENEEENP